ncbi:MULTISPECIES: caspase family protein [unclassified Janthinobacterium]|uniref:caspase family protein n=1 Tax=unclassified Janthinobacterium TaxID=2610881 RepID=UPI00089253A1|nr:MULTISPECIES: caspase family protein [unclassified Janthinobacterium]SDA57587.1 Caspase domain-containing protein [Janthinobacterium sp. 551a]SFB28669.1 Caspase domain-containing protein [Janthinobacterium sp. 344]
MFNPDPKQLRVVLVGIDQYAYAPAWRLDGPEADARRMAAWLMTQGVEPDQITMFLSPAGWQAPEMLQWADQCELKPERRRHATQEVIKRFVDIELPKASGEALLVYWGGHGLIDHQGVERYLVLADATEDQTYYVNLQQLLSVLKRSELSHLRRQVCIVDTCATPRDAIKTKLTLNDTNFTIGSLAHQAISQCILLAASDGLYAKNDSAARRGVFSHHLLNALANGPGRPGPEEFAAAFECALKDPALGEQRPRRWLIDTANDRQEHGWAAPADDPVADLLALVRTHIPDVTLARYERLYLRSLPNPTRAVQQGGAEDWLRHLHDVPVADTHRPPPLAEFAIRLAKETGATVLEDWAASACKPEQLVQLQLKLQDEGQRDTERTTLFIELDERAQKLCWWLSAAQPHFRTQPAVLTLAPARLHESFADALGTVLSEAHLRTGTECELWVGLILPSNLLAAGLEDVSIGVVLDGAYSDQSLHERYPLLLHWSQRAWSISAGLPSSPWGLAVKKIKERMAQGGGTLMYWLDHNHRKPEEVARLELIRGHSRLTCIGIDGQPANARPLDELVSGCLRQGIPCLLLIRQATSNTVDDVTKRAERDELGLSLGASPAADTPLVLRNLWAASTTDSILSGARLVWDLPSHLPSPVQLQPPFSGHQI